MTWKRFKEIVDGWLEENGENELIEIGYIDVSGDEPHIHVRGGELCVY